MDAVFGMGQGLATVVLALSLGALVLGIVMLRSGAKRRAKQEDGPQRRMLAIALIVIGVVLVIPAAISWVTALTAGG